MLGLVVAGSGFGRSLFYNQNEKLIEFLSPFTEDGQEGDFEEKLKEGDDLLFALNRICSSNYSN